ncbi:hypothetical protein HPB50_012987 [Hyalomma asiaticum]|uniref:Uncharacterized protein n=1 Tax=Hyalomma asiaticum TaxID=266040 RepID=A0ACB7SF47_HYAAI|nr:hypothetical protein HPB50_012987 [Hyalomma asiaticum]
MAALFSTVVPKKNQTAWHKAAGMFQACHSIGRKHSAELYELQAWLGSLKLDLRDLRDDSAFDAVEAVVKLSLVHGVPALFALLPDRLRFTEKGRLLTFSLNADDATWYEFFLQSHDKPETMGTRFYVEQLQDYGIEDAAARKKLSGDMALYEMEVTGILQLHKNETEAQEMTVQELANETLGEPNSGKFSRFLQEQTNDAYGPHSLVVVLPPAVPLLADLLASPRVGMHGLRALLAWSLVRQLLRTALGKPPLYGAARTVQEVCFHRVSQAMGTALMGPYIEKVLKPHAVAAAATVLDGVRSAYDSAFATAAWLQEGGAAQLARRKLNETRYLVGLRGGVTTLEQLNRLHAEKDDSGERFMSAWLKAVELEARQLLRDRHEPVFDGASAKVFYIPTRNTLVLPAGALRPTLLYSNGPPSHNYGGLGQMAASELMRAFDVKGMAYDEEGRTRPWGTTAQRVHLTSNALCLSKSFWELVGNEAPKSRFNAALEPDFDLLADFAGLGQLTPLSRRSRKMRG